MNKPGIYPPPVPPPFPKFPTMTIGNDIEPTPDPEEDPQSTQGDQSTNGPTSTPISSAVSTSELATTSEPASTSSAESSTGTAEMCAITCSACAAGGGNGTPSPTGLSKRVSYFYPSIERRIVVRLRGLCVMGSTELFARSPQQKLIAL